MYKKFGECKNEVEIKNRIDILRKNMVTISNGEFKSSDDRAIYVDWNWINYFEVRLDEKYENSIRIEIWVADVKHQWNDLSKVSSMKFISEQENIDNIEGISVKANYIGAYIKLGDSYGNTLKVADFDTNYVSSNFNKNYYKNFYQTLGGQWKKDIDTDDFIKNDRFLLKEIEQLNLVNKDKEAIINYIRNETRNVINLSLGTTINISIPIIEFANKDEGDTLARTLNNFIMECKAKIEDEM